MNGPIAELYKYRADTPEVIDAIKDLKKAKFEGKKTNLQEQYWYMKENDFMKAAKKPKEVTKKREKVKKSDKSEKCGGVQRDYLGYRAYVTGCGGFESATIGPFRGVEGRDV